MNRIFGRRDAAVAALPVWLETRVAIVLLTIGAGWLLPAGDRGDKPGFLDQCAPLGYRPVPQGR